jgi:hypothetical protein
LLAGQEGHTLTGTGAAVGTPAYMAPELIGGEASPATDQYALGMVLYELVTGKKPFLGRTPMETLFFQQTRPLPDPLTYNPHLPTWLCAALHTMLAKDPSERFAGMPALMEALTAGSDTPPERQQITPPPPEPVAEMPQPLEEEHTFDLLSEAPPVSQATILPPKKPVNENEKHTNIGLNPTRLTQSEPLPSRSFTGLRQEFARFWFHLRKLGQKELSTLKKFYLNSSNGLLIGFAILLPLIIFVIAATVYSQRGVQQQFEYYYGLANWMAYEALQEPQALVRQSQLDAALDYLNQAETYNQTADSKALREQIIVLQSDRETIPRIELFPAAQARLDPNVNLTHMVTTKNNDLYALDANSGRVLYFRFMGHYYEYDDTFQCGDSGLQRVVDLAPLSPSNSMDATILAITEVGALHYCQPGQPLKAALINVPVLGWSNIRSINVERDYLFVLDIGTRALWSYYGPQQDFTAADGRLFFPGDPPMELAQTANLDVFSDTIIFLTNNNVVHACSIETTSAFIHECLVLTPLDSSDKPIDISTFDTVDFFSSEYAPAFYLLEGQSQTLYRFSTNMILDNAYRFYAATFEKLPDNPITAFTISDNQQVILAYGNEIFIGEFSE